MVSIYFSYDHYIYTDLFLFLFASTNLWANEIMWEYAPSNSFCSKNGLIIFVSARIVHRSLHISKSALFCVTGKYHQWFNYLFLDPWRIRIFLWRACRRGKLFKTMSNPIHSVRSILQTLDFRTKTFILCFFFGLKINTTSTGSHHCFILVRCLFAFWKSIVHYSCPFLTPTLDTGTLDDQRNH